MIPNSPDRAVLGLALGSGAARGAAHAGVLSVLQEAGIRPDIIAGTSAGALIGGAFAAGLPAEEIEAIVTAARWSNFARIDGGKRKALLQTSPQRESIEEHLGPLLIEELPYRFVAVAYDLRSRQRVLITRGSLSRAMQASMAVPGLFPPVEMGRMLLVDGSIAESVPVAATHSLGADRVIAVSVGASDNPNSPLARTLDMAAPLLGTQARSVGAENSDLLIKPDTKSFALWSHRDVPKIIEAGRVAALQALAEEPIRCG